MGKPNTWVALSTGKRVNDQWFGQEDKDGLYQRLVQLAYEKGGHGVCCCVAHDALPIAIRECKGRYHLARYPGTGSRHRQDCVFYAAESQGSGRNAYSLKAIAETNQGFVVQPDAALDLAAPAPAEPPASLAQPSNAAAGTRETVGALGLLHLLWQIAGLDVHPGMEKARTWFSATTRLHRAADQVQLGGVALADHFLALPPRLGPRDKERAAQLLGLDGKRVCVVGRLARLVPEQPGHSASIRLSGTMELAADMDIWFNARRSLIEELNTRYPVACGRVGSTATRDGSVVVLLCADVKVTQRDAQPPTVRAQVYDAALMWVSRPFIPVATVAQLLLVEHLASMGRHVAGVLSFDNPTHPIADLLLLDTGRAEPQPLAVLEGPALVERREALVQRYGDHCWFWVPDIGDIPALPEPAPPPAMSPSAG